MGDKTSIEWTDATWNPVRGCSRVSAGCEHCYAEGVAARFSGSGQPYEGLIHRSTRGWNGQIRLVPEALGQPWRWVRPRRIFVNSMSDLFHENVPFEYIAAVFFVMSVTTRHTYQILTKRPARMLEFFRWVRDGKGIWEDDRIDDVALANPHIKALGWEPATAKRGGYDNCGPGWPYVNVWLGVSVEDQAAANERIPLLLQAPAAVRFLSCEPLLGPIDLTLDGLVCLPCRNAEHMRMDPTTGAYECCKQCDYTGIGDEWGVDWVIVGGESGRGARPMHPDWARSLRDQCKAAGVPFFFKQWGEWKPVELWSPGPVKQTAIDPSGAQVPYDVAPQDIGGHRFVLSGKKKAGHLLDGVEHHAFPEPSA